jgi:protein-S-isoprenylcysteine O-methyltransferase Ste14
MIFNLIIRSMLGALAFAVVLFGPAGTLIWPQGWIFLGLFIVCSIGIGVWLLRADPELLAARMQSPVSADQRLSDRIIIWAIMILFWSWFAVMALDAKRFGWSHVPLWAQILGAILVAGSFWGQVDVLRANSFAAVNVRVQSERGHTVASTGPYGIVRHPMYSYVILMMIGAPLLLGSLWGLLGLVVFVPLLAARAIGEEAVLMEGLDGYRAYAGRVRYRLLPGLW